MRFRNKFGMTFRFCTWLFLKWRPIFHPNSKRFRNGMFLCSRFNFRQSELVWDSHKKRHEMMWFRNKFGMTFRFCTWLFLKWRPIFHPNSKRFRNGMFLCSRFNFRQSELVWDSHKKRHEMMWFRNKFGMTFRFCTWLFLKWRPIFHPN